MRAESSAHHRRSSGRGSKPPRGSSSLPATLLFLGLLVALGLRGLERRASAEGFGWVDPAALDFDHLPEWADARWSGELAELAARFPPLTTDDDAGLEELRAALESLSFVRRVGTPEVVWPDGLRLPLELHEPVACVPLGRGYQLVAEDGTLLSGIWNVPPRVGRRWLPVIGPLADGRRVFDGASPGDYLWEAEHTDALDVALSMRLHLDEEEQFALGRVVIDARRAREASALEPGVRIDLEGRRRILFGRAPWSGEPGELEVVAKWRSVARALALLEPRSDGASALDWDLVDVRWDRPDIALLAAAVPAGTGIEEAPRPSVSTPPGPPARPPSTRRVR